MKSKQTILIVEDEEVNRRIIKKLLLEQYDVLEAENGAEAWEFIKRKKE